MRIVTRPDFDGIVCAVLLAEAHKDPMEIVWMEPHEIQAGEAKILAGDILANLPWHPKAALWFDHHVSNRPKAPAPGRFEIAPSAAGLVYQYYLDLGRLTQRFDELVANTDMIDSADLNLDQVRFPEKYPYLILSMTIQNHGFKDKAYWNRLVDMLRSLPVEKILKEPEVQARCEAVIEENRVFHGLLKAHTTIAGPVSVTDFRGLVPVPSGNRFLTYAIFPETFASMKIRFKDKEQTQVLVSVGHSIFNRTCRVNVGQLLSRFGGGGHAGAGGCTLESSTAQEIIEEILAKLKANEAI